MFRPESFYAGSPVLSRFWKAWKWLQAVPFRMTDREEGPAGIALAQVAFGDPDTKRSFYTFLHSYRDWVGSKGDFGLESWASFFRDLLGEKWKTLPPRQVWTATLKEIDRMPRGELRFPVDQIAYAWKRNPRMVFFCWGETPVYRFFKEDLERTGFHRGGLPSGLDLLCAGPLSSPAGKEVFLETFGNREWAKSLLSVHCPPLGEDFYSRGLKALRLLQGQPCSHAGALFFSQPWKAKMAWTQLSGWVTLEHTLALYRAVPSCVMGGLAYVPPPGAVSPYPEAFAALSKLAREAKALLEKSEISFPRKYRALAQKALKMLKVYLESVGKEEKGMPGPGKRFLAKVRARLTQVYPAPSAEDPLCKKRAERARREVEGILGEKKIGEGGKRWLDRWFFPNDPGPKMKIVLSQVAETTLKLADLSRKQWEGKGLNKEEEGFVRDFGDWIKEIYLECWDPSRGLPLRGPKVVGVAEASGLKGRSRRRLYAATGSPEALYIILGCSGSPCLYRGGVMGYREFSLPGEVKMEDSLWRRWVEEGKTPPPPAFTKAFRVAR